MLLVAFAAALFALTPVGAGANEGEDGSALSQVAGAVSLESTYEVAPAVVDGEKLISVIITLDEQPAASYEGDVAGFEATSPDVTGDTKLSAEAPEVSDYAKYLGNKHRKFERALKAAVPSAQVTQSYELIVGGVAALVPAGELDAISKMAGVTGVYLDELNQLDTETTPDFIGADGLWADLGGQDDAGEGIIVANIDSGIWPEHPSVSDPDPAGEAYPAPPAHWAGSGVGAGCDFGDVGWNPADAPFTCNNKLLGAYDFTATYAAVIGLIPTEFHSARDSNGHGTHTLTTAAGNGGVAANIYGVPRGVVSGIAPRAHVVAYKGCGATGCFSSDTMAAIQQAVADGVDVVNYSISGGGSPYSDVVSLAMLDAYNAGTLVVPSAGNSGPGADTVAHREPWTLTTGASTSDRHFISTLDLVADNSDTLTLEGASVTSGIATPTAVVFPPAGEGLCLNPFAAGTFSGEIVICERGVIARVAKSYNVAAGGGGGLLLYNPVQQGLSTDNHFIPSVHLENDSGVALLDFMSTHTGVAATFTQGAATAVQGDVMAPFSSRGGPRQTLGISKPDVTAPGVQILAGMTPLPESVTEGFPGQLFQAIGGTSMSAPHSTGAAALIKAAHPDWGPAEVKSALMMTALTDGVVKEDGTTAADPFDYGSGRILPDAAADAQLVITETGANYLTLADNLWDANYPSLYVPTLAGAITVQRTVTNPTAKTGTWKLTVDAPSDLDVSVPHNITVKKNGGTTTFGIAVDGRDIPIGEVRHATLTFEKVNQPMQGQSLHFPITVVRAEAAVTIDKTCDPATIARGDTTSCTITVENATFDDHDVWVVDRIPSELKLDGTSIVGGTRAGNTVLFHGSLTGAAPPAPDVVVDPLASPFGYVPLAGFGPTDVGATDESIANFNVPSFEYAGESYNQIGIVSNGYLVIGGGTGADVNFINSDLPDAAVPNNVLAPFWTDLNPAFGGRVLVAVLTDGTDTWTIVEWESVRSFGDVETTTAQVWLGTDTDTNPAEDIFFTYGADVSDGDGGFLTVGVENAFGNQGGTVYFDGAGTPPAPSFPNGTYEVNVFSVPGVPGETHTITFDAEGKTVGEWWNWAEMTSTGIAGTAIAGFQGEVIGK
jgi:subtilisin family serine protease